VQAPVGESASRWLIKRPSKNTLCFVRFWGALDWLKIPTLEGDGPFLTLCQYTISCRRANFRRSQMHARPLLLVTPPRMIIVEHFGRGGEPRAPAVAPGHSQDRNAMTPVTASLHLALPRCCPGLSKATCYIVDHAKIAQPTAAAATNSLPRSSVRRRLRQPTHLRPKPPPSQIPIDGRRPPQRPAGSFLGGFSDAGPHTRG
jgi:hypothetical protein